MEEGHSKVPQIMREPRVYYSSISLAGAISNLSEKITWAALGTFGLSGGVKFLRSLPEGTQIIVGIPDELNQHTRDGLMVVQKQNPNLSIYFRSDFHAKYALFRTSTESYVMIGSANLTNSGYYDVSVLMHSPLLFRTIADKHLFWVKGATPVDSKPAQPMSKEALKGLLSKTI